MYMKNMCCEAYSRTHSTRSDETFYISDSITQILVYIYPKSSWLWVDKTLLKQCSAFQSYCIIRLYIVFFPFILKDIVNTFKVKSHPNWLNIWVVWDDMIET